MKALGVEPELYVAILSSILLSKFPPDLHLIVSHKVQADDLNLESILKMFKQELLARDRAEDALQQHGHHQNQNQGQNQVRSSTSAFVAIA